MICLHWFILIDFPVKKIFIFKKPWMYSHVPILKVCKCTSIVSTLTKKIANQSQSYPYSDKDLQCYDIKCTNVLHIRVSKCGLETRKSPSPSPIFGDKVGTGKGFLDSLGKIWGLEELNFWGLLGKNPLKNPQV